MKKILVLNKKEGETPLEALGAFRFKNKKYKDTKMTYAGRLDPMANGLLLVLVGNETKNKEKYLVLDKEYNFEILFGFATDTYDILGKVISARQDLAEESFIDKKELNQKIQKELKHFRGRFKQKFPMYSSRTVLGRSLFSYARAGEVVESPEKEVNVKKLKFLEIRAISKTKLLQNIKKRILKVKGDFRQKEILKIWRQKLSTKTSDKFFIASFKIKCTSGTYVRGIAHSLGEKIGIGALAFSIKRTKIGKWSKIQLCR